MIYTGATRTALLALGFGALILGALILPQLGAVGLILLIVAIFVPPVSARQAAGLPESVSSVVQPLVDEMEQAFDPLDYDHFAAEARASFAAALHGRGVPEGVYQLCFERDGVSEVHATVERKLDGAHWSLAEFSDFIDLGTDPKGNPSRRLLSPNREGDGD